MGFQPKMPQPSLSDLLDTQFCELWNAQADEINDALRECFGPLKGKDMMWKLIPGSERLLSTPPQGGSGDCRTAWMWTGSLRSSLQLRPTSVGTVRII